MNQKVSPQNNKKTENKYVWQCQYNMSLLGQVIATEMSKK